jgi:aminoglycoside phosphotransferase (APT) family kinase protein
LHPRSNSNETMCREMRLLQALADQDVPHPRLIAACPESDVLGASFYLMEPIEGFNLSVGMPALHAGDRAIRRRMGFTLIDGILRLGRVDHLRVGLHDFGRIDGFLERQVGRWRSQLEGYCNYHGWPGPQVLPGVDRIGAWLERHRPNSFQPGILHGDYHFANVLYRNDGPDLAAIVDWELATIGDPLIDLGWVLAMWPRSDDPTSMKIEPWDGFPDAEDLIACYREGSERNLEAISWYVVFACYKLGILLEGTHARACAGEAIKDVGDRLHLRAVALFERALALL